MSSFKIVFNGIKWNGLGNLVIILIQVIQLALLSRFFSKEEYGVISLSLFFIQFSNIFGDMGMTVAIFNKKEISVNQYSSVYWFNIILSVFIYFILILLSGFIADFYNVNELNKIIPLLGLNIIFLSIGRLHKTFLLKDFHFKYISVVDITSNIIGLGILVVLIFNDFGIYSLFFSLLITSLISSLFFLFKNFKKNPIKFFYNNSEIKPFFNIGIFTVGSSLLDFFSREFDVLIIGKVLGTEILGLYSLSKQIIIKLLSLINPVMVNVLNPLFSSIQDDFIKLKSTYATIVKNYGIVVAPIFSLVIFNSEEILFVISGNNFVGAKLILSFLAFIYSINAILSPIGSLQVATGRTDLGFYWTIFRIFATIPTIYIGAKNGILFLTIILSVLSVLLIFPIWFIQIKAMIKLSFKNFISLFYKPILFITIVLTFTYYYENIIFINDFSLYRVIVKTILLILFYLIFLVISDYEFLKKIKGSILNKKA